MENSSDTAAVNPPLPTPERTSRIFRRRWVRYLLALVVGATALITAFYTEEDWRGQRDWNRYQKSIEARGESLDLKFYIPKPVPDDQNFCATPFLKALFQTNYRGLTLTNDLWFRSAYRVATRPADGDRSQRQFTDLVAWRQVSEALRDGPLKNGLFFDTTNLSLTAREAAAPTVLEGMKPDEAVFAELRAASTRPYSVCPEKYDLENPWPILAGYLAKVKYVCQHLSLEECSELAAGQTDQALVDVKLSLSLADSCKSEPFLIPFLVRVACFQISTQPVWEGLAEHRWDDAQLQELQARFLSYDFLSDLHHALYGDRAAEVILCNRVRKLGLGLVRDYMIIDSSTPAPPRKGVFDQVGRLMPSGWYDQEELNFCRLFEDQLKGTVDYSSKTISPHLTPVEALTPPYPRNGTFLNALLHHRLISSTMYLGPVPGKTAIAQTCANQIVIACALERYRLANGQFPETLDALTPRFIARLPHDVIGGQPYKYRRTDDEQFILYSIGWDEKDDGGVPGKDMFDMEHGDWVWSYPSQ